MEESLKKRLEKSDVVGMASAIIKPTLWWTNSILDDAEFATDLEIEQLKKLTAKTASLKKKVRELDSKISEIFDNFSKRSEDSKQKERKQNYEANMLIVKTDNDIHS